MVDCNAKVGLALISRDYKVLDANPVHLARWPDLKGATCFAFCNSFSQPCAWCPVKRTFADGGVHHAVAASPHENAPSESLEYSNIVSFPVGNRTGPAPSAALEVLFNLTSEQRDTLELSNALHGFLERLCGLARQTADTAFLADLLLLASVSRRGLRLDEATVLRLTLNPGIPTIADDRRRLLAVELQEKDEIEVLSAPSPDDAKAVLDALRRTPDELRPNIADHLNLSQYELRNLIDSGFPRRIDAHTLALAIRSPASPECLILVAKSLVQNGLLLDHQLNEGALLQAIFIHAFDAARVGVPISTALTRLKHLLGAFEKGGENIAFAAPVAFGLAHDLKPAMKQVTDQIMRLEGELLCRQIDRTSLDQILQNLKRAEKRFKVCSNRLESIATLFKQVKKNRERCHLNAVVEEVHDWLRPDFEDRSVILAFRPDDRADNDLLLADRVQVFQVVYNVVSNAFKAVRFVVPRTRRRILVRTLDADDSDLLELLVTDFAGSLMPDIQANMYEPFFTTQTDGTGLGLWIVKSILDRVGVTPEVSVRAAVSTTFRIRFPREW